jgi:hypothetical protein
MLFSVHASALETAPAPAGKALVVARKVIGDNFDKSDCPAVTKASRLKDGSIRATCSNGEAFRIFTVVELHKAVAMRCSAAEKIGVPGC